MSHLSRHRAVLSLALIALFVADRAAKWFTLSRLRPDDGFFLLPPYVGLVLERNQGIAYSIPLPLAILAVLLALIIVLFVALAVRAYRRGELWGAFALSLVVVGTISNALDRLRYGYVIDYATISRWPVFNIADLMITAGVVILIIQTIRRPRLP